MQIWVIFVACLLINWLVNITETFKDILKHCFLQTNVIKSVNSKLQRTTLTRVNLKFYQLEHYLIAQYVEQTSLLLEFIHYHLGSLLRQYYKCSFFSIDPAKSSLS